MQQAAILQNLQFHPERALLTSIMETPFSKEIRICMKENTALKSHKAAAAIVVEVVEGEIIFGTGNEVLTMQKGMLVSLEAHVPHSLEANQDSVIRLSVSKQLERPEQQH